MAKLARRPHADFVYNLILVGKYGVGKTTLMNTAVRRADQPEATATKDVAKEEAKNEETQGRGVDFRILQTKVDDRTVDIKIFDTGDMERHQNEMTSNYYRCAHVALLVYDITDSLSFDSLRDDWLDDTDNYCPRQCIRLVVANKVDRAAQRDCDEVTVRAWAEKNNMTHEEVSAIDKDSVEKLFTRVAQLLLGVNPTPASQSELAPANRRQCCAH